MEKPINVFICTTETQTALRISLFWHKILDFTVAMTNFALRMITHNIDHLVNEVSEDCK